MRSVRYLVPAILHDSPQILHFAYRASRSDELHDQALDVLVSAIAIPEFPELAMDHRVHDGKLLVLASLVRPVDRIPVAPRFIESAKAIAHVARPVDDLFLGQQVTGLDRPSTVVDALAPNSYR